MSQPSMKQEPLPDFIREDEFMSSYPCSKMTVVRTKKPIFLLKGDYQHQNVEMIITESAVNGFMIDGKRVDAEPGMIFAIHSGQRHGTQYLSRVSFTGIQFQKEFLQELALGMYGINQVVFHSQPVPVGSEIVDLVDAYIREHEEKKDGHFYLLNSLSVQIAIAVFRRIGIVNGLPDKGDDHKKIQDIVAYYGQNYNTDISLDKMSDISNMSKFSLIRKFKESTGMTPHDYLLNTRIMKALEYLNNPNRKIIDACMMSGFDNQSYFSRVFKKKTGLTPSEYRKKVVDR